MDIPTSIKLGGIDYEVELYTIDPILHKAQGMLHHKEQKISIGTCPGIQPSHIIRVLLHELVHAILDQYCPPIQEHEELEEAVAHAMDSGMLALMRDNPEVIRAMLTGLGV